MDFDRPIAIALILFAVLLMAFFLVAPQYNGMQSLQTDLAEKKAEYNAQFDYYSEITAVYNQIESNKDAIQKIDDALPIKPDLGQLVYYFQGTAKEDGLVFKNLSLSQSPGTGNIKDLIFSLSLTGNYSSLENFIVSLEKSDRIFEVTSVSFSSPDQATSSQFEDSAIFTFNLEIKAHSY